VEEGGKARAKVTQIPLRLAWAITVHKSQGMSMDAAAIDLSRAFEYGQGYVALSRVRSLAGLHILGWSEQALIVHPLVVSHDEVFRQASEDAIEAFAALDASGERLELEKNFVTSAGGVWHDGTSEDAKAPRSKPAKVSTYAETQRLLESGLSPQDIATERKLTFGTICGHIEKLVQGGTISRALIQENIHSSLRSELPRIHDAFRAQGSEHLTPIYELLEGTVTFDDLRLARTVYEG
jgi:hypothetical protein